MTCCGFTVLSLYYPAAGFNLTLTVYTADGQGCLFGFFPFMCLINPKFYSSSLLWHAESSMCNSWHVIVSSWTPPGGKTVKEHERLPNNNMWLGELKSNRIKLEPRIISEGVLSPLASFFIQRLPPLLWPRSEIRGSPNSVADQKQVGRPACAFHLCRM